MEVRLLNSLLPLQLELVDFLRRVGLHLSRHHLVLRLRGNQPLTVAFKAIDVFLLIDIVVCLVEEYLEVAVALADVSAVLASYVAFGGTVLLAPFAQGLDQSLNRGKI